MKKFLELTLFFLFLFHASLAQNTKTIEGRLTDNNGNPLAGATIQVVGSVVSAITNENGKYVITARETDNLEFTHIGFSSQIIRVGNQSSIDVQMVPGPGTSLETVVVTALGIKRSEKALGYSVQKVSGENLQKVAGVDVATSLTGKVAGLLVKNSPDFAALPDLTIRGEKPLLVIDGIAYANKTLSDISAEDIESVSVLKGATASALYGFRGANGAVIITTKNGSTNKSGVTVDFTTNTMFTAGYLALPERQNVYGRGNNNTYNKYSDESWGAKMDGSVKNQWDPKLMEWRDFEYLPVGKNNFQNFLEQGYVTNNNVNFGYRTDVASLRSSLNWTQNKGRYPNSTLNKYTYTFGGDVNLGKFQMSSNLAYSRRSSPNVGSNGYTSYDPMYSLLIWSPSDYNILDYKNNYWYKRGLVQNFIYGVDNKALNINNPYFDRYEKTNEIARDIFNADLSLSYKLTNWLKATVRSGIDFYKEVGQLRTSMGSYLMTGNTGVPGNQYTWNGYKTGGYNIGQNNGLSINSDLLFAGDKSAADFSFEYMAGGTIFYKKDDNLNASTVGGLSVPDFFSIKASVNPPNVGQSTTAMQVNSLFGRLGIGWKRMLFVDVTGRNDWSSTLPKETRSYFYPSVAGSFVVSELLPDTRRWMDLLKLRGSWTVSKRPANPYEVNSTYTLVSGTWGTLNGADGPSALRDPHLTPETSTTFETGIQSIFFKNRLMADVSYYDKTMRDPLIYAPLSPASGYTSIYKNFGEVISRRGWEVILNGTPLKNDIWQWDLGANWSTFKRVYVKLDSLYSSKKPWIKVGERADAYILRDFLRDPNGNQIFDNGRLKYSSYDSRYGFWDPDWIWGLNSTLRYKNLSLYLAFDGVSGGLMNTRTESYMWQAGVHPESLTPEREKDVATPNSKNYIGQGVKVTSGTATFDKDGNITSDTRVFAPNDVPSTYKQYILDLHSSSAWGGAGSPADTYSKTFIKLREISLTYNFPQKWPGKYIKAASASIVGQNVWLKAKNFKYSDPDGGSEDFADPAVRYIGFNIKFTL